MCGDWNINFSLNNSNLFKLTGVLQRYNLINRIITPTRSTKTSSSLIDVIITEAFNGGIKIVNKEIGFSDHTAQIIYSGLKEPLKMTIYKNKRNFTKMNIEQFKLRLNEEVWDYVYRTDEINTSYQNFLGTLVYYFNIAFPLKKGVIKTNFKITWITRGILKSRDRILFLQKLTKTMALTNTSLTYIKNYQAIYRTVLKEEKRIQLEKQVITAINKPKKMWDIINNELGKYNRIRDNIEIQNGMNVITNPLSIAERFNSYFIDIIMELKGDSNMLNLDYGIVNYYSNSFYLVPVTDHEVEKTIKNFKNSYSMGVDGFPETIIKNCGPYLIKPLVYIFNLSFQSGIFPDMLKVAKIIPIHKNGDQRIIANYRPISILSVFSKILEKIMYKRLISFLHKNNILSNEQFCFRQGKSTELACHTFLNNIQEAIDKKYQVIGLFLDLSKAYDVLNHQILLEKLERYGIRGITNKWFHSYLSNRIQMVEITHVSKNKQNKFLSTPRTNLSGVPQGSILGPLLFLL
jgi:hypothetical protein